MPDERPAVGVLGGMGPGATIDFLQRVVRNTQAEDDADHVRILVDNNPGVPSRIDYVIHGRGENPAPTLVAMARGLVAQGAGFLVMPCNTAHLYADDISTAVNVPFVNMIDVTLASVMALPHSRPRAGLLASTAVVQTGLYEAKFRQRNVTVVTPDPDRQERLMSIIKRVKANRHTDADRVELHDVAAMLGCQVDCLVIACTELSAFSGELRVEVPVIDAAQCLAEETLEIALGRKPL